jgi:hypothetical protein
VLYIAIHGRGPSHVVPNLDHPSTHHEEKAALEARVDEGGFGIPRGGLLELLTHHADCQARSITPLTPKLLQEAFIQRPLWSLVTVCLASLKPRIVHEAASINRPGVASLEREARLGLDCFSSAWLVDRGGDDVGIRFALTESGPGDIARSQRLVDAQKRKSKVLPK